MNKKILIYQVFTRLYGNNNTTRKQWGTVAENGTGKFADFNTKTLREIKKMGFSHIWFTGVIRHATQTDYSANGIPVQHPAVVKGKAGSPYAICDYYDIDPDLATKVDKRMEEFEALINRTHRAGLKVIMDFVPNHVARQYKSIAKPRGVKDLGANDNTELGFSPQNNFYYCPGCDFEPYFDKTYGVFGDITRQAIADGELKPLKAYEENPCKATGNDCMGNHPGQNDWYETVKLNYGIDTWTRWGHFDPIPDTWNKMTDIIKFWAAKGVDGFRCDMAEMVPAAFWTWAIDKVRFMYPDIIFIGEVYNPNEYRNYIAAGFDYLYDKVGMYDAMRAVTCGYAPAHILTSAWQTTDDINSHMLYFLENHDEQRIASDFFAGDAGKGIPAMIASVLMRPAPFMLYAGEEYGEKAMDEEGFSGKDGRTTIFDYWSIDTLVRARSEELTELEKYIYAMHEKVMQIARNEKAVDGDFYDMMYANPMSLMFNNEKQYVFFRKKDKEMLLVVVNFDDKDVDVTVRIPSHLVEYHKIPEKEYTAKDLLTDYLSPMAIIKEGLIPMTIHARSARVWKMVM